MGAMGAAGPIALMVQGQHGGRKCLFRRNLFRISATSETFGLLSFCKCDSPLSKDGFQGSFFKKRPKELMSMWQVGRIRTFQRNAGNG